MPATCLRLLKKKMGHYLLNGRKVFISNGRIARVFIVLAKTKRDLAKPSKGIAMFIVDHDTRGGFAWQDRGVDGTTLLES